MKVKEVSEYFDIKRFTFRESMLKTNNFLKEYGKFIIPMFVIYQIIDIVISKVLVFLEHGRETSVSLFFLIILINITSSILGLLYTAYIFCFVEDKGKNYFTKSYIYKAVRNIGSMIITLLAIIIKSYPVIIISVIFSVVLNIAFPINNQTGFTDDKLTMIVTVLVVGPVAFYLILKYSFSIINTLKFNIKGFSAVNLSSSIFGINKKQLLVYGMFLILIPMTLSLLLNFTIQNSILKILMSIL